MMAMLSLGNPEVEQHTDYSQNEMEATTCAKNPEGKCGDNAESVTYDVAIVGAGASGLFAAVQLVKDGKSVAILEARDRIGGRLLSVPAASSDQGQRLDLGATWFWPDSEPRISALLKEASKEKANDQATSRSQVPPLQLFSQYHQGSMQYAQGGTVRAVPNQLDQPGTGRVLQGMASVTDYLYAELKATTEARHELFLQAPVATISSPRKGEGSLHRLDIAAAEFVAASRVPSAIFARHVLLALPPALAVHKIRFDPPLGKPLSAVASRTPVWMGAMVKGVAEWPQGAFWKQHGFAGSGYDASGTTGPLGELHDMSGPTGKPTTGAIFGFGSPGDFEQVTEDDVKSQMRKLFGAVPGYTDPTSVYVQDWRSEEWTSPPNGAALQDRQGTFGHNVFQDPTSAMSSRGGGDGAEEEWSALHWCSTETARSAAGHVEGAIEAASRAVKNVLAALGKN